MTIWGIRQRRKLAGPYKNCHKFFATFVLALVAAPFANGHPLEDAAERATALCMRFDDVESVEQCGTGMGGGSPERTAARMAVKRVFMERTAFMRECQAKQPFEACAYQAEWLIGSGMSRLNAPVQHTDAPSRSDARR